MKQAATEYSKINPPIDILLPHGRQEILQIRYLRATIIAPSKNLGKNEGRATLNLKMPNCKISIAKQRRIKKNKRWKKKGGSLEGVNYIAQNNNISIQ